MALIECPECGSSISDKALFCPQCGFTQRSGFPGYSYEYRSKTTLFGLPLVHIVSGRGTGQIRIAKGIIAVGDIAVGVLSFGGLSLGLVSFGGLAIGLAAMGGLAIGALLAIGGMAIGFVAIGGGTLGYYILGGGGWGVENLHRQSENIQIFSLVKRYVISATSHCLKIFGY